MTRLAPHPSLAIAASRLAQEPRSLRIAHHTRVRSRDRGDPAGGVPALVLIREPEGAVVTHRGDLVVGTFSEVVGGELGTNTRLLNTRFGTDFAEFEPTESNVARCLREIDEDRRERRGDGERLERIVPRPSPVREELKAEMTARYDAEAPPKLRRRAERLYAWFTDDGERS
jgi:hypothetical protein